MKCIFNKKTIGVWLFLITSGMFALILRNVEASDPTGIATYGETDSIAGLKYAVNFSWTLLGAFLVFIMQAGFALLGGFLRQKNMLSYMAHCFIALRIRLVMQNL